MLLLPIGDVGLVGVNMLPLTFAQLRQRNYNSVCPSGSICVYVCYSETRKQTRLQEFRKTKQDLGQTFRRSKG